MANCSFIQRSGGLPSTSAASFPTWLQRAGEEKADADDEDLVAMEMGNLCAMKLVQLRDVCTQLNLQTPGPRSRKRTFIDLEAFAKTCSCRE